MFAIFINMQFDWSLHVTTSFLHFSDYTCLTNIRLFHHLSYRKRTNKWSSNNWALNISSLSWSGCKWNFCVAKLKNFGHFLHYWVRKKKREKKNPNTKEPRKTWIKNIALLSQKFTHTHTTTHADNVRWKHTANNL